MSGAKIDLPRRRFFGVVKPSKVEHPNAHHGNMIFIRHVAGHVRAGMLIGLENVLIDHLTKQVKILPVFDDFAKFIVRFKAILNALVFNSWADCMRDERFLQESLVEQPPPIIRAVEGVFEPVSTRSAGIPYLRLPNPATLSVWAHVRRNASRLQINRCALDSFGNPSLFGGNVGLILHDAGLST